MGRNPTLDANSPDMKPKQAWTVEHRTHVQACNRAYYLRIKQTKQKRNWLLWKREHRRNRRMRNKRNTHMYMLTLQYTQRLFLKLDIN